MALAFFEKLGGRATRTAAVAAAMTLAIGLSFRMWRPEAGLTTPEYVAVFAICWLLAGLCARIIWGKGNGKAGALLALAVLPLQAQPGRQTALVIGNAAYPGKALAAAVEDAGVMSGMLRAFAFRTETVENAGLERMRAAIRDFTGQLRAGDTGLLFYAGYCAQTADDTFLIPVDFTGTDPAAGGLGLREAQGQLAASAAGFKILVAGGCRDYAAGAWRGTAPPSGAGTAVVLAMEPAGSAARGTFIEAMDEALRRSREFLGALLGAAGRFARAADDPRRAQVNWQVSGSAERFWITMREQAAAKPPAKATVREFLARGQKEAPRYGLYSYLLFAGPPAESERQLYVELIGAYLKLLVEAGDAPSFAPPELNITYVPVKKRPQQPTAEQVLAEYDYDRALAILVAQKGGEGLRGAYLISSLAPLADVKTRADLFVAQSLANVPPHLAPLYIREFEACVSRERSWTAERMDQFLLAVRTAIGKVAEEGAAAAPAFQLIVDLVKKAQ